MNRLRASNIEYWWFQVFNADGVEEWAFKDEKSMLAFAWDKLRENFYGQDDEHEAQFDKMHEDGDVEGACKICSYDGFPQFYVGSRFLMTYGTEILVMGESINEN